MLDCEVKTAKLYYEDGKYYIDATYIYEDDAVVKEINFPKICIPLEKLEGGINYTEKPFSPLSKYALVGHIKLGGVAFGLGYKDGVLGTEKIIKEKTRDMTISEIEKKLGYKIRIVKEK